MVAIFFKLKNKKNIEKEKKILLKNCTKPLLEDANYDLEINNSGNIWNVSSQSHL